MNRLFLWPSLLVGLLCSHLAVAELLFTAPPRETPEEGAAVFNPLAELLTELVGEKVTYVPPTNWGEYARDIWEDKYDFFFDGPHFAAWREVHTGHRPLARLKGHLHFYVVARAEPGAPDGLDDLRGETVCAISSPNMMASVLLAQYSPVTSPEIFSMKGSLKNVYKALLDGKCKAAVLRSEFVEKMDEKQKAGLKILFKSRFFPNQMITVSKRVNPALDARIIKALTQADSPYTKPVLERFGHRGLTDAFVPVNNVEHQGLNLLLQGVVWGW